MELEAHRVGGEGAARQPGPFDRAFALLLKRLNGLGSFRSFPPGMTPLSTSFATYAVSCQ
jgi:hypothetical protein